MCPSLAASVGILLGCVSPAWEQQTWIRVGTPSFELVSSADPAVTKGVGERLERFRSIVFELLGVEPAAHPGPTLVYVFGDEATFDIFSPQRPVQGFMVPSLERNYLAVNASDTERAIPIAYHEFVHLVLRSGRLEYPAWLHEGVAELLSTTRFSGRHVEIGRIPVDRAESLRYGSLLSLRRVMTARNVMQWSDQAASMFYAEAWALAHYLLAEHSVGSRGYVEVMQKYLGLFDSGLEPEAAFEQAFDMTFEEFEPEFLRYMAEGQMPYVTLEDAFEPGPMHATVAPLAPAEQRVLLGDLAHVVGQERWNTAESVYRKATEAAPADALAAASLARMMARRGARGAEAAARRIPISGSTDAAALQRAGDAWRLLARETKSSEEARGRLDRARDLYRLCLERDPERIAALTGIAATLGFDAEANATAIAALEIVNRKLPGSPAISVALAERYAAAGRAEDARPIVSRLSDTPHAMGTATVDPEILERLTRLTGLDQVKPSLRHLTARLDVTSPSTDDVVVTTAALAEVSGRGGLSESLFHDVVLAIDESNSTLAPSGRDLDGDGKLGRGRRHHTYDFVRLSTDAEDSILSAELEAARHLIQQLDPLTTRVAVVPFTSLGRVLAPLGTPADAIASLDDYRNELDLTGTSLANALATALEELARGREVDRRRQRSIILLSDGKPTYPSVRAARRRALEAAAFIGKHGVHVHAYALGPEAVREETYRRIAELTGGRFVPVQSARDVVAELAALRLTGLRNVTIRNLDSSAHARAVRLFADGSFGGFVPLEPGTNRVEIIAEFDEHEPLREVRKVFYDRPLHPTPQQVVQTKELLRRVHDRTAEIELLTKMKQVREAKTGARRELSIELEDVEADDGPE